MPTKNYWTQQTDESIHRYNNTDNVYLRNKIFNEEIHEPLLKVSQSLSRKLYPMIKRSYLYEHDDTGLHTDESIINDCLSFLTQKLKGFNPNKSKGFSYFSVIARNHLLQNSMLEKRKWLDPYVHKYNVEKVIEFNRGSKDNRDINLKAITISEEVNDEESSDLLDSLRIRMMSNKIRVKKDNHLKIIDEIILLLEEKESWSLSSLKKKPIYARIREKLNVTTPEINYVMSLLREDYLKIKKKMRVPIHEVEPNTY